MFNQIRDLGFRIRDLGFIWKIRDLGLNPRSVFIKIMNCLKQNTFLFQLHYRLVNVSSIRYNMPSCYSKVVNTLPPVPWCLSSKCLCLLTVCTSERSWMDFGHWRARSLVSIMSDPRSLRYGTLKIVSQTQTQMLCSTMHDIALLNASIRIVAYQYWLVHKQTSYDAPEVLITVMKVLSWRIRLSHFRTHVLFRV